jgi:internalin A
MPHLEEARQLIAKCLSTKNTALDLRGCNITDLNDLPELFECVHLTMLDLSNNQISDITPIAQLTNLTWLGLSNNPISDITPIAQLTNLTGLGLRNNQISDITPIAQLANLTMLDLSNNQISDITPIAQLANLTLLNLNRNQISDITPIAQLANLTSLHLNRNQISDITPIAQLVNLTLLDLSGNQISDITPIAQLANLTDLDLSFNQISDITPVAQLANLTSLYLDSNQISDITPVAQLANLTSLYLASNQISNITPIAQLANLTSLHLSSNPISDITPIAQLANLTSLYLRNNKISDITPIAQLVNLTLLDLSGNQISDITPIAQLANLTELELSFNQISDITPVAQLANLTSLHLSNNYISDITPIAQLANLTSLDLSNSHISNITPIAQLANLTSLGLRDNHISDITPIAQLANLTSLYLDSNQISNITPIAQLANLTLLNLNRNQISDITPIAQLANLTWLGLDSNQISDITPIAQLANLTGLELSNNQISDITPIAQLANLTELELSNNQIHVFPDFLLQFKKLYRLDIQNNPHHLYIPDDLQTKADDWENTETKDTTHAQALIQYIGYAQKHSKSIKESKIIFVGDASVGKSSLIKKLLLNTFDKDSKTTEKIEIYHDTHSYFLTPLPTATKAKTKKKELLTVHFWDFGGQEIQHSLHKLFLSERCVYVVVTAARTEDKAGEQPLEYWLELVSQYGGDSPVLIALNKIDEKNHAIPEGKYHDAYKNIQLPAVSTDCKTGRGIADLKKAIQKALDTLPHLHHKLPKAHFEIKKKLQKETKEYLHFDAFEDICKAEGKKHSFEFSNEDVHYFATLLHDLGAMVYFSKKSKLTDKAILNPAWISEGMYKVMTADKTGKSNGILSENDINAILESADSRDCTKIYVKKHEQGYILNALESFELAYKKDFGATAQYFIPRLFVQEEPAELKAFWKTQANNVTIFRYQYNKLLPNEIMARLIYRLHSLIYGNQMYREGFLIKDEHTYAYIKANTLQKCINISLTKKSEMKYLLYQVRQEVKAIHATFANLSVSDAIIYVHKEKEYPLDYEDLVRHQQKKRMKWISEIDVDIDPNQLLGEIDIPKKEILLKLIDENQIDAFFENLQEYGGDHYSHKLKQEFMSGTSKTDSDYHSRLKMWVREMNI